MSREIVDVDGEAKYLSERLLLLGRQAEDIFYEFCESGYALAVQVVRDEIEAIAIKNDDLKSLRQYWLEFAMERLAGLVGPMDILARRVPECSVYRSSYLDKLYEIKSAGGLAGTGSVILSPQIQATMKIYVEMMPDDPLAIHINQRVKQARKMAVNKFSLSESPIFCQMPKRLRYELLAERLNKNMLANGFGCGGSLKTGLVFRKRIASGRWDFFMIDDSADGVSDGVLAFVFGLVAQKRKISAKSMASNAAATFVGDDIVPGFAAARVFATDSNAEFCLAIDACSHFAGILCDRMEKIMSY